MNIWTKLALKSLALVVMLAYIIYAPGGELAWIWKDTSMEAIAIGVFVFVTLAVGGLRAMKALDAHKAKVEAERRERALRRRGSEYTGARYNVHGNEVRD